MGEGNAFGIASKEKACFVEGLILKPKSSTGKEEEWWTINTMVGSWILNAIEPNLRTTMPYAERCNELWADLKE